MQRILIIKLRYVGDVVLCTPILPLLRKKFPEAKLTFVVNEGTQTILYGNPHVDEILTFPRSGWRQQLGFFMKIRQQHFDAVIDLTDADRSAVMARMSGAKIRIGFNRERRWRGKLYSHVVSTQYGAMHMVDYHAQVLPFLGIDEPVGQPELFVNAQTREFCQQLLNRYSLLNQPLVLLHPSARYEFKAWPLEYFAALADWLFAQGANVAMIGSQREYMIGHQIMNLAKKKPHNLMGQTRVTDLVELMKASSLLIGNDGGPLHIASAVGCPVVGLFGPTDPAVWGPRGQKVQVLYKGLDCRECFYPGCFRGDDSCMRQIALPEVCEAVRALIPSFATSASVE